MKKFSFVEEFFDISSSGVGCLLTKVFSFLSMRRDALSFLSFVCIFQKLKLETIGVVLSCIMMTPELS